MFHRKGNLLALKWKDKRDVYILTGIHKADSVCKFEKDLQRSENKKT